MGDCMGASMNDSELEQEINRLKKDWYVAFEHRLADEPARRAALKDAIERRSPQRVRQIESERGLA
jgi:hypothetical protein